ncbi:MAG TPA: AI-2E family transporter [Polyangia bacterium]|nr:AI-2E family transporter [Polyangia bacterium]
MTAKRELRPSQVSLKTVFTASFGVLAVVAVVLLIANTMVAVALTGAALMLSVALDHVVRLLGRRGIGRSAAVALTLLGGVGVLVVFGLLLIPPAIDQGKELVRDAPGFLHTMRGTSLFGRLDERFHLADQLARAERELPHVLEGAASPVLAAVGGVLTGVGFTITIAFLTAFMLIFGGRLVENVLRETRADRRFVYEDVIHKIYRSIGGYLGGLLLICLANATCTTTFLAIDRVPFFLPLGICAGMSSLIPYAGPFVAGTLISLIAFATRGTPAGVAAAIYFVVYGQLEGNLLAPLVFRRTVHVNPLVVTLSILFLGELAGVPGAIAAVPVVASLQVILREILAIRRGELKIPASPEDAPSTD